MCVARRLDALGNSKGVPTCFLASSKVRNSRIRSCYQKRQWNTIPAGRHAGASGHRTQNDLQRAWLEYEVHLTYEYLCFLFCFNVLPLKWRWAQRTNLEVHREALGQNILPFLQTPYDMCDTITLKPGGQTLYHFCRLHMICVIPLIPSVPPYCIVYNTWYYIWYSYHVGIAFAFCYPVWDRKEEKSRNRFLKMDFFFPFSQGPFSCLRMV